MRLFVAVYIGSLLITSVFSEYQYSQFQYIGCFLDQAQRELRGEQNSFPYMTQEMCLSYCKRREFLFAGLQNGNLCFCGDEIPVEGDRRSESDCNILCHGEQGRKCGGAWRNAIYYTGAVPPTYEYVGCYLDVEGYRRVKGYYTRVDNMSLRSCIDRCRDLSFKYAGLQAGWACFCGNEAPNSSDRKDESECNSVCPLDNNNKCGGALRNSVYRTLVPCNVTREYRYSDYSYMGCFLDSDYSRLRGEYIPFPYMTQQMCLTYCKRRSFRYAGLQNGISCFCGDETPLDYDLKPGAECSSNCFGEQVKKCGGPWRNAVYCIGEAPPKNEYLGCYLDEEGNRKLKGYYIFINQMTPRSCIDHCRDMSYKYAGLQAGNHCFCGNDDPVEVERRGESECGSVCPGDYTHKCGGALRNSIYKTF